MPHLERRSNFGLVEACRGAKVSARHVVDVVVLGNQHELTLSLPTRRTSAKNTTQAKEREEF